MSGVGWLGSGWVVTEIEKVGGWSVCLGLCGVVGWLERRGVRCLEVWLDKDVGDLEGRGWKVGELLGCYRD